MTMDRLVAWNCVFIILRLTHLALTHCLSALIYLLYDSLWWAAAPPPTWDYLHTTTTRYEYRYELCPVLHPVMPIALYEPCTVLLHVRVGHPLIRYSLARLSAM